MSSWVAKHVIGVCSESKERLGFTRSRTSSSAVVAAVVLRRIAEVASFGGFCMRSALTSTSSSFQPVDRVVFKDRGQGSCSGSSRSSSSEDDGSVKHEVPLDSMGAENSVPLRFLQRTGGGALRRR